MIALPFGFPHKQHDLWDHDGKEEEDGGRILPPNTVFYRLPRMKVLYMRKYVYNNKVYTYVYNNKVYT